MLVANARLLAIQDPGTMGSGSGDDYDESVADVLASAAGDPTATDRWRGSCDAYLEQKTVAVTTPTGRNYERRWNLYLDLNVPSVNIRIGDLLTLVRPMPDGTTLQDTIPVISDDTRMQPDMPSDVQSRALTVEPASQ